MADVPFFRGVNRLDWLIALELQTAADWQGTNAVERVAEILGGGVSQQTTFAGGIYPPVTLLGTQDYMFILCGSTRGSFQWIGNVLGSVSVLYPGTNGFVTGYFVAVAEAHYQAVIQKVKAGLGTRKLVLVGFSLGAASAAILKEFFRNREQINCSCIAFASPRAGTSSFAEAYPTDNYEGITVEGDPVPSVPPQRWSAVGAVGWVLGIPPIEFYPNLSPNQYLSADGRLHNGGADMTTLQVVQSLSDGSAFKFHSQALYAKLIRQGLPQTLPADYDGIQGAPLVDANAPSVFFWESDWPFGPVPANGSPLGYPLPLFGVTSMPVKLGIFIRTSAGNPPSAYVTQGQRGFEEVYFLGTGSPSSVLATALSVIVPARRLFLSGACEIYAVRASNVGNPRASALYRPPAPLPGLAPFSQGMADIEDSLVYMGFDATLQYKRQFHFRGVDASAIADNGVRAGGTYDTLVNGSSSGSFFNVLKAQGLLIFSTKAPGGFSYPVTGGTQAAGPGNPIVLGITAPLGVPTGALFDLRGCRGVPLLNGRWQAIGPQLANQVTLSGSDRYGISGPIGGTISQVGPNPQTFNQAALLGGGKKATGRPPFSPRGRQSARLRRR